MTFIIAYKQMASYYDPFGRKSKVGLSALIKELEKDEPNEWAYDDTGIWLIDKQKEERTWHDWNMQ